MNFVLANNAKTNNNKRKINQNRRKNGEYKGLVVANP
jgi:hypothetical protein